jgi:hypothetical protein
MFYIENKDDIFAPGKNSTNQKFDLLKLIDQNKGPFRLDWFEMTI